MHDLPAFNISLKQPWEKHARKQVASLVGKPKRETGTE